MPRYVKGVGKQFSYTANNSKNWYNLSRQSNNTYQNFKCAYPLSQGFHFTKEMSKRNGFILGETKRVVINSYFFLNSY